MILLFNVGHSVEIKQAAKSIFQIAFKGKIMFYFLFLFSPTYESLYIKKDDDKFCSSVCSGLVKREELN